MESLKERREKTGHTNIGRYNSWKSPIFGECINVQFKKFIDPETRYTKSHKRYIIKLLKTKGNEKKS